jgi:hypothetical protein
MLDDNDTEGTTGAFDTATAAAEVGAELMLGASEGTGFGDGRLGSSTTAGRLGVGCACGSEATILPKSVAQDKF